MNKNNNDISKSSSHFNNYASGIKFNYKNKNKNKLNRKDLFQGDEYSCEIEIEEKPELNRRHINESQFKPSTKQAIDQNEYKKFKKKFDIEEIDEKEEDEQIKEENNSKINSGNETPPSRIRKNIYTEKYVNKKKIILDDEDEEKKIEDNINNSSDDNDNKEEDGNKNNEYNYKYSKGIKSEGGDFEHKLKFRKKKRKKEEYEYKWDEEEYQKIKSEAKNYLPFKEYDIKKYLLTPSQIDNIKRIPELSKKYSDFLSLKKKQDKIQNEVLIKNILIGLNSIYKNKSYLKEFKVNHLINEQDLKNIEYKSIEKTSFFDLFICFISMYVNKYENFVEKTSIPSLTKLLIPLHALAFIFSSQVFFCDIAKLIQYYYSKYLSFKIIPIYIKEKEEYRYRIDTRQIIWKQFEPTHFYYKNKKQLYSKDEKGEEKMNDNNIKKFSEEINNNIQLVYNDVEKTIFDNHKKINLFSMNDNKITITNRDISAPSSLYQQISNDPLFKLKMNLYKYKMKQLNIKKAIMINEAKYSKNDFNNKVKTKIFKQSNFYMSPCDVVQDFLDNYD